VKTSDKRSLIVDVYGAVAVLGPRLAPAADGLGGGVTNTSDVLPSVSAHGLDGGVWKDSKLWSMFKSSPEFSKGI
jgi:hypothetical protein